jgi:hypothetical protein
MTRNISTALRNTVNPRVPLRCYTVRGDVPWPARSPDLSACDYFLWGFLKSRVFISKPTTIAELKQSINEEIVAIPEQMTRRVTDNL